MQITEKEYDEKLDAYLRENGPNPGTTFFGSWGWYAAKKNEFQKQMQEQGVEVITSNK